VIHPFPRIYAWLSSISQRSSMSSKSNTERRHMYIARTPLQIRRAYFHSFVTWQKNWRQRSARNVRANTKGGRAYGQAVPCVAWVLLCLPLLTSVLSQSGSVVRGDIPPVPDWISDLAQQAGMSDSAERARKRVRENVWLRAQTREVRGNSLSPAA
jgi:hypothetical protein